MVCNNEIRMDRWPDITTLLYVQNIQFMQKMYKEEKKKNYYLCVNISIQE
jgi:hypothetical protein